MMNRRQVMHRALGLLHDADAVDLPPVAGKQLLILKG